MSQDIIIVAVVHAPDARDLATVGATARDSIAEALPGCNAVVVAMDARDIMSEGALFAQLVGEAMSGADHI